MILNYKNGYSQYIGLDAICIGYPFGEEISDGTGKIVNVKKFEFEHNIPMQEDYSDSPVILFQKLKVIGVHKIGYGGKNKNIWNFIGEILDEKRRI